MKICTKNFLLASFCWWICQVDAGQWLLIGGYKGAEGQTGTSSLGDVELLTLTQENKFGVKGNWCQRNLANTPIPLDGATVDWVDAFHFISSQEGNSSFTSSHHSTTFKRALVCGGADKQYKIQKTCR